MTRKEAARQLGLPEGTLAGRLTRGRAMLAKRLARHGLAVSGGALAALLSQKAASACVPTSVLSNTIKAVTLVVAGKTAAAGLVSAKVAMLTEGVLKAMLLNKLKIVMTVLFIALGMVVLGRGLYLHQAGAQQGPANLPTEGAKDAESKQLDAKATEKLKDDKDKLQGTWLIVSGAADGNAFSDEVVKDRKVVIENNRITEVEKGKNLTPSDFVLHTTKNPKAIDATPIDGDFKDMTHLGIYTLEGDDLKVCFGKSGDKRPNDFTCERRRGMNGPRTRTECRRWLTSPNWNESSMPHPASSMSC